MAKKLFKSICCGIGLAAVAAGAGCASQTAQSGLDLYQQRFFQQRFGAGVIEDAYTKAEAAKKVFESHFHNWLKAEGFSKGSVSSILHVYAGHILEIVGELQNVFGKDVLLDKLYELAAEKKSSGYFPGPEDAREDARLLDRELRGALNTLSQKVTRKNYKTTGGITGLQAQSNTCQ